MAKKVAGRWKTMVGCSVWVLRKWKNMRGLRRRRDGERWNVVRVAGMEWRDGERGRWRDGVEDGNLKGSSAPGRSLCVREMEIGIRS